jgi:hypothetical protein
MVWSLLRERPQKTMITMPRATLTIAKPSGRGSVSFLHRIIRRSLLITVCAAGLPGCATVTTDDHQSIVITSDPPGATCQVRQGGAIVATVAETPSSVLVGKSRHDIGIDCIRAGYYPGAAVLQPHFQDMTLGNILYGWTIGLIVDTSSGAINEYPRWVDVLMTRQPLPGEPAEVTRRLSELELVRQHALRDELAVR